MQTLEKVATLKWDNFKSMFDESWHEWMEPIITNLKFARDFAQLREYGKTNRIIPSRESNNLFRVFREVPYDKMVAVVVGLSPYNGLAMGKEIADGIALSCGNTFSEQPSLTQWYNAMEKEFGNIERDCNLKYLCDRGVLMYNYSMTCGFRDATCHVDMWEWFSQELFRTAISIAAVPVITLGKEAQKVTDCCAVPWQPIFNLKHPASASYSKTDWDSEGAFTAVQKHLQEKGIAFSWVKYKDKF
jgi:uracil DNA glycosylase